MTMNLDLDKIRIKEEFDPIRLSIYGAGRGRFRNIPRFPAVVPRQRGTDPDIGSMEKLYEQLVTYS
jgi:hypothetical protein